MATLVVYPPFVFRIRWNSKRELRYKDLVCGLDKLSCLQCSGSPSVLFDHAPSTERPHTLKRRQPRHPHPEASQGGIRKTAVVVEKSVQTRSVRPDSRYR